MKAQLAGDQSCSGTAPPHSDSWSVFPSHQGHGQAVPSRGLPRERLCSCGDDAAPEHAWERQGWSRALPLAAGQRCATAEQRPTMALRSASCPHCPPAPAAGQGHRSTRTNNQRPHDIRGVRGARRTLPAVGNRVPSCARGKARSPERPDKSHGQRAETDEAALPTLLGPPAGGV